MNTPLQDPGPSTSTALADQALLPVWDPAAWRAGGSIVPNSCLGSKELELGVALVQEFVQNLRTLLEQPMPKPRSHRGKVSASDQEKARQNHELGSILDWIVQATAAAASQQPAEPDDDLGSDDDGSEAGSDSDSDSSDDDDGGETDPGSDMEHDGGKADAGSDMEHDGSKADAGSDMEHDGGEADAGSAGQEADVAPAAKRAPLPPMQWHCRESYPRRIMLMGAVLRMLDQCWPKAHADAAEGAARHQLMAASVEQLSGLCESTAAAGGWYLAASCIPLPVCLPAWEHISVCMPARAPFLAH